MQNKLGYSLGTGIVTLGVFSHANAGKTTLTEHLLMKSGLISDVGRVDLGNTVTDFLEIERKRGITVQASYVTFELNGNIVQLIDTPGHIEFSSEVIRAINVLDAAILVISGAKGIESQTYAIWNLLKVKNIPTFFFINKLDTEGADYGRTLTMIHNELTDKAVSFIATAEEMIVVRIEKESLYKNIFQNNKMSTDEYECDIRKKVRACSLYPVFGGSALKNIGIDIFYKYLEIFLPFSKIIDSHEEFCGYVYMIRYGKSKDIYIKVLQGKLFVRDHIINTLNDVDRVKSISKISGNKRVNCTMLYTHEIGIISGIDVKPGMLIGKQIIELQIQRPITPLFTINITSHSSDDANFRDAIYKLAEEDPELNLRYDNNNKSFQIDIIGGLQGESIIALLKEKFNVDCIASEPRLIYQETPTRTGVGKASYTSNSGVILKVSPLKNGKGIQFKSNVSSDILPFKFQKQVERLVYKFVQYGSKGWAVTDICIELEGGTWDHVASVSQHFNIAVPIALARAIQRSRTKLLEPLMKYEIRFNEEYIDLVLAETTSFQHMYSNLIKSNASYIIKGHAFISELKIFMNRINNITHGHNRINFESHGYEHNKKGEIEINSVENSPHNIYEFIASQFASVTNLDRGLKRF
jgi:ribosomal protection tetracycline resistance protein